MRDKAIKRKELYYFGVYNIVFTYIARFKIVRESVTRRTMTKKNKIKLSIARGNLDKAPTGTREVWVLVFLMKSGGFDSAFWKLLIRLFAFLI